MATTQFSKKSMNHKSSSVDFPQAVGYQVFSINQFTDSTVIEFHYFSKKKKKIPKQTTCTQQQKKEERNVSKFNHHLHANLCQATAQRFAFPCCQKPGLKVSINNLYKL